MSRRDDCRETAADCLELARIAPDPAVRARFMLLASKFHELAAGIGGGAQLPMSKGLYSDDIEADLSVYDLPLDAEGGIDNAECAHVLRRIGVAEDELGTPVSAFNSSI